MLYDSRPLNEFVNEDLGVWLNGFEFARPHNIDGKKILSVLTSNKRAKILIGPDGQKLNDSEMILFVKKSDVKKVMSNQSVKIDGKIYLIKDAQDIQGVIWKIFLEGNVS